MFQAMEQDDMHQVLDTDGKPVTVPIKAGAFYSKPRLKFLEAKFKESEQGGYRIKQG